MSSSVASQKVGAILGLWVSASAPEGIAQYLHQGVGQHTSSNGLCGRVRGEAGRGKTVLRTQSSLHCKVRMRHARQNRASRGEHNSHKRRRRKLAATTTNNS